MNTFETIRISRDKIATKNKLQESGVRTPELVTLESVLDGFLPFVLKDRYGYGGKNMEAFSDTLDAERLYGLRKRLRNPRLFLEKLVKCTREYRVFVVRGEIVHVCVKVPDEGTEDEVIRNASNSKFVVCRDNLVRSVDVKTQALAATESVGLARAAVDIGLQESGEAWVWETNTRPAITRDYVRALWNGH